MTAIVVYPEEGKGRGAWPSSGAGGTLSADGMSLGRWYRAPATGSKQLKVGLIGYRADRDNAPVSVNDYAVYKAVQAMQKFFGTPPDGIWGADTDEKVRIWQKSKGLVADGVFGVKTSTALWTPVIRQHAKELNPTNLNLPKVSIGHITWESAFDAGAVGGATPEDLGIGQINGPAHPDLSVDQRLDPVFALKWVVGFVDSNLLAFPSDLDAGIAAYNLGKGGTRSWIRDGRPDVWTRSTTLSDGSIVERTTDVRRYINEIKKAGGIAY